MATRKRRSTPDPIVAIELRDSTMSSAAEVGAALIENSNREDEAVDAKFVTVCDSRGNPHRTYSLELHGEHFRALAEMYISDRPGWLVKDA